MINYSPCSITKFLGGICKSINDSKESSRGMWFAVIDHITCQICIKDFRSTEQLVICRIYSFELKLPQM